MKTANFTRINLRVFEGFRKKTLRKATCKETISSFNEKVIRPIVLGQVPVAQELKLEALKLQTEINRKLFELPAKAERQPARPVPPPPPRPVTESMIEPVDGWGEGSGTKEVSPSMMVGVEAAEAEEADTERFTPRPPVDDVATTLRRELTSGNGGTQPMTPERKRAFFDSMTRMVTVGSRAFEAVKEVVERGKNPELISAFERLIEEADMYRKMADGLSVRVGDFEAVKEAEAKAVVAFVGETEEAATTTVTDIFNDRKRLPLDIAPSKILDRIEQTYPKLARRVKTLRSLLQGGKRNA